MNKVIVERAVDALAALNGPRRRGGDSSPLRENTPASVVRPEAKRMEEEAACGSPQCAGCYDVGEGRKIHPPRCGEGFLRWRAWMEGKGQIQ